MSQSIQIQVTQVGLEQSIAAAMKRVGSSSQINLGTNSKQINALSQPLGRITGQADEFSKSMAAANARVLAFGASAGILAGVSKAMSGLVASTIKVEKSLTEIGSVLNTSGAQLDKFGQQIFSVAKNTGQSFEEVAKGALELSRQGLSAEDTLSRLNDALILSRLSGIDATQSVEGLTAAFNSFQKSGITTAEILNKVVAVSQKYAVSERDIIEGVKRSASVAQQAGVSFEELAAVITAVQQTTARGGAVIGNSFKTIFARIQRKDVLAELQGLGVAVTDLQGNVLPAIKILQGLATEMSGLSQIEQASIAEKLGGVFQLDKLLAALKDLSSETSVYQGALVEAGRAGDSAYKKNIILNQTLASLINKVAVSAEELGAKLGEIGVTDSLKNILGFFNNLLEGIKNILGEESGLGKLVTGLVKGLGSFLAGPGLALFGAIILKLSKDLVVFGFQSLKAFFGIGKAAKEVQNVEGAISQILAKNVNLQQQLFALEGNRAAQLRVITAALVEQEAVLRRSSAISSGLAAPLYNVGARATGSGLRVGNSADGYMPAVAKESKAIKQGVGGARSGDKPVVMPNFNFGGGKKGTMVAHTGEYVVPNFNGSGGSAVFNRQMVQSMGLPSGAKKINAAGGLVPQPPRGYSLSSFAGARINNPRAKTQFGKRINENIEPDDKISTVGFDIEKIPIPKELEIALKEDKKYLGREPTYAFELVAMKYLRSKGLIFKQGSKNLFSETSSSVDGYRLDNINNKEISLLEVKSGKWTPLEVGNKFGRFIPENVGNNNLPISSKINDYFTEGDKGNWDLIKLKNTLAVPNTERGRSFIRKDKNKNEILSYSGFKTKSIATAIDNKTKNSAGGFIPNFADARPKAIDDEIRKYIEAGTIQNYIRPGLNEFGKPYRSYWFPDGTQAAPSQVERVMKSSRAVSAVKKDAREAKMAEKGIYNIDAKKLGGIALISPKFGAKSGVLDTNMAIGEIPFFNFDDSPLIDKNKYIKLSGIQTAGIKNGDQVTTVKDLEAQINDTFKGGVVDLAYRLYGKLFSQTTDWTGILNKISSTKGQQLLPPAAQGDLLEAASKVAVNSWEDALTKSEKGDSYLSPSGIFSAQGQNRPFDFSNKDGIEAIFGINAERGEAKRGGEKNFEGSRQVQGIIKKVFNDPVYSSRALKILDQQGAFNLSEAQKAAKAKNAFGGYIPNFAQMGQLIGSGQESNVFRKGNRVIKYSKGDERQASEKAALNKAMDWAAAKNQLRTIYPNLRILQNQQRGAATIQPFAGETGEKVIKDKLKALKLSDFIDRKFEEARSKNSAQPNWLSPLFFDSDPSNFTFLNGAKGDVNSASVEDIFNANKFGLIDLGVLPLRLPDIKKRAASGFIPNFAGENPNRGFKYTAAQIAKGLGKAAIKLLIDQYLGDGVVDSIEASGLSQMKPSDIKYFAEELKKPTKGKHRQAFENALKNPETKRELEEVQRMMRSGSGNAAGGFLPNFANPLQAAVGREMAAGVPASQIYIDKSPALKNAANPMGLMVANRRDEPAGGFQGINRARREGANPMMYGAAGGFVPNYASLTKAVSKETGIKIYAGPVQDAIDKFAKESLKAGADMKKLAKQLEDELKIVTQGNPISKQLAQVAQEEIVKRKEIIAAKALESTAGKKVSSKLDKILQEYNQSEKTAKDLAKAQAKAAAALNKTTLNEIKKSAITSNIGSLATTRPGAQPGAGGRDMLGTLFAVQGAMSALTGATDDASSSVARYGNIVADGAGSFTTAAFAIQGISQMGGAIGGIASKLGPYGLAIAGTLAVLSIAGKAIDEYTGINKSAAASMAKVAEAAQKAAVKLEELSPTAQAKVKESSKNLVSGATNILYQDTLTGKQYTGKTEFEGFDAFGFGTSELEKSLQASVDAALAAGVSYDLMWNTIREAAQSDGKVTKEEVDSLVTKFAELQTTADQVKKTFGSLDLNIESGIGKSLISMDRKTVEAYAKRTGDTQYLSNVKAKMAPITELKKALAESNPGMDVNSEAAQKLILDQYDMLIQKSKEKSDAEKESGKTFQVNLEKLKTELEFNKKLSKIKNDAFTSEQAIRQAIADIESGSLLSEQDKAKAILDINFALEQQGKLTEENIQSQQNLQKAISSALADSIIDPSAYQSAFDTLFAEIQSKGDLTQALLENPDNFKKKIVNIVDKLKLPPDLVKPLTEGLSEALVLNKNLTDEQRKQLEQALQKLGIDSKQLDITNQRAILERKITEQYDRFKEGRSLDVQIKAVDLANESLSINKEIEQVKNNYLFSEFEKAKKIYDLEKQRFELSKQSVEISGEERQLNLQTSFTETLRNRIRDSALPEAQRQELLNAPELYNPDALINRVQQMGNDRNLIDSIRKEQEIQRKREELTRKQIEGERAGLIAPSEPGSEQKQRLGFFGGIDASLGQMRDATKVFEYELGEKIPQMFSSGLSEAISSAIEGAKDLDDALREAAYNFVKTINQQLMNNLVNSLIGNIGFLPKPAAPVTMASGGKVTGGSGSKDDVPAMLMGGEYVVNKKAVAKYGPQFLEAINNGTLSGYAKGGSVQRGPQGNFYTPGTFGQGAISGKRNLLDFATQSGTSGKFDQIINESGYQAIALEPESSRLSVSGMRNSPAFEATQQAKGQAFDLYLQQYNAEREAKKQAKAQKKALIRQIGMLALSAALGPVIGAAGAGFGAAFKGAAGQGFMSQVGAGFKGIFTGGQIGNQTVGGLGNLFSGVGKAFTGDFGGAINKFKLSQIGTQEQLLSAMKNEKFASYINQQGGFIPKATAISSSGAIPLGMSRNAGGVTLNSNDGDIIKSIQRSVGVSGSDIEAELLPKMQSESNFNLFRSIGSGAGKIGSIFSNFLGSGYGPFDKDGNYVEEWADNPSKWGISQFVRRASGGMMPLTSGVDTIPAMLSGGEFVMNRSAVQSIGAPNLQSMNAGGTSITSEETSKELNEKLLAKLDELINASGSTGNITINVAPSGQTTQENAPDSSASRQQLARQIKDAVLQIINDEKRIGGSLRR